MQESLETVVSFFFCILQAMDLDIPVLARNIPGNAAIIKHKETGLLFSTPQVRKAQNSGAFSVCIPRLVSVHSWCLLRFCWSCCPVCAVQGARPRCQPCWMFVGAAQSPAWALELHSQPCRMLWVCQIPPRHSLGQELCWTSCSSPEENEPLWWHLFCNF